MLLHLISVSALLFLGVTWFCVRQGLFSEGSMGIGQMFAAGLYIVIWFGGTALATLVAFLVG